MAVGTPIRLVQENGKLTELDAQTMVLTTSRKVGGAALPFTGSKRIGMDLNVNKAMINIQGVITDDIDGVASKGARAEINFGRIAGNSYEKWATKTNFDNLFSLQSEVKIQLWDSQGVLHQVPMRRGGSGQDTAYNANIDGSNTKGIFLRAANVAEDAGSDYAIDAKKMATALHDYITNVLSAKFTSSPVDDTNVSTSGKVSADNAVTVKIQQIALDNTSSEGNHHMYPDIGRGGASQTVSKTFNRPSSTNFAGGTDKSVKSAGDKVQDIYGVINNSVTSIGRTVGSMVAIVGGVAAIAATGGASTPASAALIGTGATGLGLGLGGIASADRDDNKDYFCGLQIPFNSKLKATDGEMYTARNFFIPTGWKKGLDKTSESSKPASTTFDKLDEYTGIQGSIQKMDITYNAGEAVYEFNMIFAPIAGLL